MYISGVPRPISKNQRFAKSRSSLRIDLHHVKRLAHHVELGHARGERICIDTEDIEFIALDNVNRGASGNRLETRDVKVLAER
jgi:hypothetical protein